MVQPAQLAPLVQTLLREQGVDPQELQSRGRQGRLGFAASLIALTNNCNCEPCQILRQSMHLLLQEARKEIAADAPGPVALA
jgi:hypothetical protein